MERRRIMVSLPETLISYATEVGMGNVSIGITNIVSEYMACALAESEPTVEYPTANPVQTRIQESAHLPVESSRQEKTKDDDAEIAKSIKAISSLLKKPSDEKKDQGTSKGKALLQELSLYNYVLTGDVNSGKAYAYLKSLDGCNHQSNFKKTGSSGWRINKASLDNIGMEEFITALATIGCEVTVGESLYTDDERKADEEKRKKKDEVKSKKEEVEEAAQSAQPETSSPSAEELPPSAEEAEQSEQASGEPSEDECYDGLIYTPQGTVNQVAYRLLPEQTDGIDTDLYYYFDDKSATPRICKYLGCNANDENVFLGLRKVSTQNDTPILEGGVVGYEKVSLYVEKTIMDIIKMCSYEKAPQWIIDAYESTGDTEYVKVLKSYTKTA